MLFRLHRAKLFAFVVSLTKSENVAEDIIQEIFLKLWEQRDTLREVENPAAYIFILVRNKTMDHLRKLSNDQRLQKKAWESIVRANKAMQTDDMVETVEVKDTEHLIDEAIGQLSPQQQKIFLLSRTDGMSHEQIADRLGISKNTVKNHLTASLLIIRKYLRKYTDMSFFWGLL